MFHKNNVTIAKFYANTAPTAHTNRFHCVYVCVCLYAFIVAAKSGCMFVCVCLCVTNSGLSLCGTRAPMPRRNNKNNRACPFMFGALTHTYHPPGPCSLPCPVFMAGISHRSTQPFNHMFHVARMVIWLQALHCGSIMIKSGPSVHTLAHTSLSPC